MLKPRDYKLYNASAGSGKTYTLVKEFLLLLLNSSNPTKFKHLLAITFTNKAANEMKERIVTWLNDFTHPDDYTSNPILLDLAKELDQEPEKLHLKSKKILTHILHNYSLLSVSTIDKFNLTIMRTFAKDLNLSVNFDVEIKSDELIEESVDVLFSELGEKKELTDTLVDLALEKMDLNEKWDYSKALVDLSKELNNDKHLPFTEELQKKSLKELNQQRKSLLQKRIKADALLKKTSEDFLSLTKNYAINDFKGKTRGLKSYFSSLPEKKILPSKSIKTYMEEGEYANVDVSSIDFEVKKLYSQALSALRDFHLCGLFLKSYTSLSVSNEVEKNLQTLMADNNSLLISEFNKRIYKSLKDQPVPFIYERLGVRYQHYFIDEFQDTSTLQWNNLLPLIENAQSQKDTILLVGDPKQSIYQFRGGNPQLMMGLTEESPANGIELVNLTSNYRSSPNIVAFNNELYTLASLSLLKPCHQKLFEQAAQQTHHLKGGKVQINLIEKETGATDEYIEASHLQLLKNIKNCLDQGISANEIAILVNKNKQGVAIAQFLSKHKIKTLSNEALLLKNAANINAIIHLLYCLSEPEDKKRRSRLLYSLHQMNFWQSPNFTQSCLDLLPLDIAPFLESIGLGNLNQLQIHNLYDWVEAIIQKIFPKNKLDAYLLAFLDFTLEYNNSQTPDIPSFLRFWERKKDKLSIALPANKDAVQLMTIHKSKGLEFRVVMVPFVEWKPNSSQQKIWLASPEAGEVLVNVSEKNHSFLEGENLERLTEMDQLSQLDTLNKLYVATTRPTEQLYLTTAFETDSKGKVKHPQANNAQYFLKEYVEKNHEWRPGEWLVYDETSSLKKEEESEEKDLIDVPNTPSNWKEKLLLSSTRTSWQNKNRAILYGNLIHELLGHIATAEDLNAALRKINQQQSLPELVQKRLKEKAIQLIQHPELSMYFTPEFTTYNERDFLVNGESFRPDRFSFKENQGIIIDYKTGEKNKKHQKQLNRYQEQLIELNYPVQKKILVYLEPKLEVLSF